MKIPLKKFSFLTLALIILTATAGIFAQKIVTPVLPKTPVKIEKNTTSEKSLAVDAKINISICVLEGNLKINGWERGEMRVFVDNGSQFDLKISQKNAQNDKPVWVRIIKSGAANETSECLSGANIEIDVPRGASLIVKGQETKTTIDRVRKASVKSVGGDIFLNDISEGIEAQTYEGDITAENCGGAITLESGTGNITAFETAPSDIGDVFRAKTNNGAIVMQSIAHHQIEANSISGTIVYKGEMLSGGLYNFNTLNGAISLTVPANSSCKVVAAYGLGGFNSELPISKITEDNSPRFQKIVGTMGSGEATLNLTTSSGAIKIKGRK